MAVSAPALRPRRLHAGRPKVSEQEAPAAAGAADRAKLAPLLAVCGVCGGAGASTLSYLLARFAVRERDGHVLVCDTGGPTSGLASYAGVQSPRSLSESADQIARGLPLADGLYVVDEEASRQGHELRVIATGPRWAADGNPEGLRTLLSLARRDGAHALVVVDCGTLQRTSDRLALRAASHIAWVLPATRSGVCRAEDVLAAVSCDSGGREQVVARRQPQEPAAALKSLKALAAFRRAPLVLMPHVREPLKDTARALQESQLTLHAIRGALQR